MIVASLVLILGAVVLLVLGLMNGSSGLLVGSIGTSLLAAVALVVGVRQAGAARAAADLDEDEDEDEQFDDAGSGRWSQRSSYMDAVPQERYVDAAVPQERLTVLPPRGQERMSGGWDERVSVPSQAIHDDMEDEDPPDEPLAQRVSAADAARVARMSTEVLVIDGRPRYHVAGCVHLLGRPFEPLAVSEAVDLGFSPCGLCEPDSALLADARRV